MFHVHHAVGSLSFIWCDYSNLFWFDTSLEEPCSYLLYARCLGSVEIGGTRARDLLLTGRSVEEHRLLRLRPGKIYHSPRSVHCKGNKILCYIQVQVSERYVNQFFICLGSIITLKDMIQERIWEIY